MAPRLRAALIAAALASPQAALAQTFSLGQRTVGEGLVLPPESAATVDDSTAGTLNPAGLGLMHGLQLAYFHEREAVSPGGLTADGLYGAATIYDVLAAGLSFEWLRPGDSPAYVKTHFNLALAPDRTFSLGVAYNLFGSSDPLLGSLTSWDVGLTWRPIQYLSLAGSARDFDNPALGTSGAKLPRRFDGALALRPFGPNFSLAGDYLFFLDGNEPGLGPLQNGPGNGRVGVTAQLDLPSGFSFLAGAGFPVGQNQQTYGQIGIRLATEHVAASLGYAPATPATPLGNGAFDLGLRLSKESFPSLPPPAARVLNVDLAELLSPRNDGILSVLESRGPDPYEALLSGLARAADDRGLRAVILRINDLGDLSLGRIEELRAEVAELRAKGKTVIALLGGGGDRSYYLATACEKIYALPQTDYPLHGFAQRSLFFAEGLQKIGVRVDVVRVGPYKGAPDALTRTDPSPEQLEVTRALLHDAYDRYLAAVTSARGVAAEAFKQVLDRGLTTAEELKAAGLIDAVLYPDELDGAVSRAVHQPVLVEGLDPEKDLHQATWSNLKAIAVVNVFGLITGGESQEGPLALMRTAGSETVVRALRAAQDDRDVAAVVVRVDSGGGDGAASELIWRAIQQLKRHKPVVVSFGDVAASGGYYLAVAGDEILAEPSTVTGSIGVFALKPDLSGLIEKLGVHAHEEALTPNADLFSLTSPWSDGEKAVVQAYIDSFYAIFVKRVADGRQLSLAAVEAVGRGHVWSGHQAKDRGLIDGYGSFLDAIDHAKARAHLRKDQEVRLVTYGSDHKLASVLGTLAGAHESQAQSLLRTLVDATGAAPTLLLGDGKALALPEQLPLLK